MGIVGDRTEGGKVPFFRTSELINSLKHLEENGWNISSELSKYEGSQYEGIRKYLQSLYTRVDTIAKSENKLAKAKMSEFEALVCENPQEADYQNVAAEIQEFYTTCGSAHEHYSSELKSKFDAPPVDQAKAALQCYNSLKKAMTLSNSMELLQVFSQRPIEKMEGLIKDLTDVETFAKRLYDTHSKLIGTADAVDPLVLESALSKLEEISDRIEEMEVAE
jgi:hypothetical protein